MIHVSKPIHTSRWTVYQRNQAKRLGYALLAGVGVRVSKTYYKEGQYAAHYRRPLTEEEMGFLGGYWLSLPAIDEE